VRLPLSALTTWVWESSPAASEVWSGAPAANDFRALLNAILCNFTHAFCRLGRAVLLADVAWESRAVAVRSITACNSL